MQGGKLGLLSLTCVIYLVVSGGAYGTEDAVHIAGPRLTLAAMPAGAADAQRADGA